MPRAGASQLCNSAADLAPLDMEFVPRHRELTVQESEISISHVSDTSRARRLAKPLLRPSCLPATHRASQPRRRSCCRSSSWLRARTACRLACSERSKRSSGQTRLMIAGWVPRAQQQQQLLLLLRTASPSFARPVERNPAPVGDRSQLELAMFRRWRYGPTLRSSAQHLVVTQAGEAEVTHRPPLSRRASQCVEVGSSLFPPSSLRLLSFSLARNRPILAPD